MSEDVEKRLEVNDRNYGPTVEKRKRIFENEEKLVKGIIDKCELEDTKTEYFGNLPIQHMQIVHSILATGQHVYRIEIEEYGDFLRRPDVLITTEELNMTQIHNYARNYQNKSFSGIAVPENGVYIKKEADSSGTSIEYIAKNDGKNMFEAFAGFTAGNPGEYAGYIRLLNGRVLQELSFMLENDTLIDTMSEIYEKQKGSISDEEQEVMDVLINDFKGMLKSVGRDDLEYTPEAELQQVAIAKQMNKEKEKNFKLENEVSRLEKEKQDLENKLEQELNQNAKLVKENVGLKERFQDLRKFMTERAPKIPFFGKKLLRELKQELGENELPQ